MESVTWTLFVAIIIPLTGGVIAALYILFTKISYVKTVTENNKQRYDDFTKKNKETHEEFQRRSDELKKETDQLWHEYTLIKDKRNEDLLRFTETLSGVNITLGEVKQTLQHLGGTVHEIKGVIESLRKTK